jgi:hypothetical protein
MSKYIIYAIIAILTCYQLFVEIEQYGYSKAEAKYIKILDDKKEVQDALIKSIETSISENLKQSNSYTSNLSKDISKIKADLSNKPLVVYKDGTCTLTDEYLVAREKAINKANQR